MANESLFDTLATEAQLIPGTKVAVGGNAPVMVNSFRREGVSVLLGAQMTEELRRKIDPEVKGNLDVRLSNHFRNKEYFQKLNTCCATAVCSQENLKSNKRQITTIMLHNKSELLRFTFFS